MMESERLMNELEAQLMAFRANSTGQAEMLAKELQLSNGPVQIRKCLNEYLVHMTKQQQRLCHIYDLLNKWQYEGR